MPLFSLDFATLSFVDAEAEETAHFLTDGGSVEDWINDFEEDKTRPDYNHYWLNYVRQSIEDRGLPPEIAMGSEFYNRSYSEIQRYETRLEAIQAQQAQQAFSRGAQNLKPPVNWNLESSFEALSSDPSSSCTLGPCPVNILGCSPV